MLRNRRFWEVVISIILTYGGMMVYYHVKYGNVHTSSVPLTEEKAPSISCKNIFHIHIHEIDDYLALIGILALVVGFLAAWEAYIAANKSEEIEESLTEVGLLASEVKTEFKLIFDDHLIKRLNEVSNQSATIRLAISTPSYGYGVLGQNSFVSLHSAFSGLNEKKCSIEIAIFSPDAHFHYWSNLLMWAIEQKNPLLFAKDFAQNTKDMLLLMKAKASKIWLMRETTVRFFAYSYHNKRSKREVKKAYFSLVDRFSLYQNQFKEEFQATSLPVFSTQINDYIEKEKSFFERIKNCPYSQHTGDAASIDFRNYGSLSADDKQSKEKTLNYLISDFLLGRTHANQIVNFKHFSVSIDKYVYNLKEGNITDFGSTEKLDIIIANAKFILNYFATVLIGHNLMTDITKKQLSTLKLAYKRLSSEPEFDKDIIEDVHKLFAGYKETTHDAEVGLEVISDYASQTSKDDQAKYLLYMLITSGFEESVYASQVIVK